MTANANHAKGLQNQAEGIPRQNDDSRTAMAVIERPATILSADILRGRDVTHKGNRNTKEAIGGRKKRGQESSGVSCAVFFLA